MSDHSSEVWWEDPARGLCVECSDRPTPDFVALVAGAHWGTRGLRYYLRDVSDSLASYHSTRFLTLTEHGEPLATQFLVPREVRAGALRGLAVYRSLLTCHPGASGRGLAKIVARAIRSRFLESEAQPTVVYGFVEEGNARSLAVVSGVGYSSVATLRAVTLGALWPRRMAGLERLRGDELAPMLQRLYDFYGDHALLDFEHSLVSDQYWVLREQGEIVAGVQVVPKHFSITRLAGPDGWLLLRLEPLLAKLHGFFSMSERRFVWCGSPWWSSVGAAARLLEGVLVEHDVSSGLMFLDERSSVYARLSQGGALGVLSRLAPHPRLHVMAGANASGAALLAAMRERSVFCSSLEAM